MGTVFLVLGMLIIASLESSVSGVETNLATQSLHLQSQIFRSVIANYLSRPEDVAVELSHLDNETEQQQWPSTFDDSSIHLRVLRSADRRSNHHSHHHQSARRPPSTGGFPLQKSRNQLIEEFGEETMATIEVIQTSTPFNVTNGQLIMRDLPMVERRSIPQFGGMVTLYTRKNPLRLLYYGNWCGSGGMGPPLDEIDKCCMTHDKCYGETEKHACSNLLFQKPYTIHYAWRWIEEYKQAICLRTGDRCADMTCECDKKAAACFSKHMIDVKLQGNRLRRHRKRIHPLRGH